MTSTITLFCYITLIAIVLAFQIRARRRDFDFLLRQDDDDRISLEKQIERQQSSWARRFDNQHSALSDLLESTGGLWLTANYGKIAIRDMSDLHIAEAIEWSKAHGRDTIKLHLEQKRRRYDKRQAARKALENG